MKRLYGYNLYAIDSHDICGDYLIAKDISNFNGIKTKRKHILTKVKNEEAEIRQDSIELVGTIIGHKSIAEFEYNKTTTNKVYLSFKGILLHLKIQPQDSTKPGYFLLNHNRAEEYNNMFICSADGNYYPAKELYWMTHKIGKESYYVDYAGHTTDSRTNREGDAFVLHIYIPFTDKQYLKDKADYLLSCLTASSYLEEYNQSLTALESLFKNSVPTFLLLDTSKKSMNDVAIDVANKILDAMRTKYIQNFKDIYEL